MLAKWRLITQQMIANVTYNQLITRGFAHTGGVFLPHYQIVTLSFAL